MTHLPQVTLICADTTPKANLALRAMMLSQRECDFVESKLLTNDNQLLNQPQTDVDIIRIPALSGLEGYSNFCIRDMARYVDTTHALVVQADGYVLNGKAWTDAFLQYDYIGAPFNPSGLVGNGGFSLRSKRLLDYMVKAGWEDCHPEDAYICLNHRAELKKNGFKFAPTIVARKFSIEGRAWNSVEWQGTAQEWNGELGFHSLLTRLPPAKKPCNVFHHSGDIGDIIYALPTIAALGGGALFLSIDNRYPYPLPSRWGRTGGDPEWINGFKSLLEAQPYIERVSFTHGLPYSTDYDLNKFRLPWKNRTAKDFDSIKKLHCDAFHVSWPDYKPWLEINDPITIPGRPIVVSRTARYQNDSVRWDLLVNKYHERMVFVGTDLEAELFQGLGYPKQVPHQKTTTLHGAARVIAGAKVFIGNQSSCLAVAHSLCKNVIAEEWDANRNCHMVRPNAMYWNAGALSIPEEWL